MASKPKTPLSDRLAELDERSHAARTRARELAQATSAHARTIEQFKADRIGAYADGDEVQATKLKKLAADAAAQAVELEERRQGADIAVVKAQRERDGFVAEHHAALVRERMPVATAAAKAIEDAVAALAEGVRVWTAEAAIQIDLLRAVPGRDGREVPELPCRELVRDLQRAASDGVPLPVPRDTQFAHIAPAHDPDPEVREKARREAEADITMEVFQ